MSDSCAIGVLKKDGQVGDKFPSSRFECAQADCPKTQGWHLSSLGIHLRKYKNSSKTETGCGSQTISRKDAKKVILEDHFEPPEDPNLECGAIAHENEEAFVRNRGYYREKDKLQGALTNKEFNEHCGNFYIFDGKDWYVSDYDCDWDQENDHWFMTSGHRALLAPIVQREYDDLQQRLSDPNTIEARVGQAMAEDTEWQATWRKRQQQRNTKLEAGKRRHAVIEKQKGKFIPKMAT